MNDVLAQSARIFRNENFTGARWARTEAAGNRYLRNMRQWLNRNGGDDNTPVPRMAYMGLNEG